MGGGHLNRPAGNEPSSSTAVAGGVAFVTEPAGLLRAYDVRSGEPLWSGALPGPSVSSPTVAGDHVYAGFTRAWATGGLVASGMP